MRTSRASKHPCGSDDGRVRGDSGWCWRRPPHRLSLVSSFDIAIYFIGHNGSSAHSCDVGAGPTNSQGGDDGPEENRSGSDRVPKRLHERRRHAAPGGQTGDGQHQYAGEHGRDRRKSAGNGRHHRLCADHIHRRLSRTEPRALRHPQGRRRFKVLPQGQLGRGNGRCPQTSCRKISS